MTKKWISIAAAAMLAITAICGAGISTAGAEDPPSMTEDLFSRRELKGTWGDEVLVILTGDSAETDAGGVEVSGGTVTITEEGTYLLTGSLNGMVIVDCENSLKVQLVLSDAHITSDTSAAIYVREADKVFITLEEGTENTLSNGGSFIDIDDNEIDAAVFSKSDLTINGSGSLTVDSPAGHGILSKDDLAIVESTITVTAGKKGLSGKDSVRIQDCDLTVTAGTDGIHSKNSNNEEKGFVYICESLVDLTSAGGDGISGSSWVELEGGEITVTCTGGSPKKTTEDMGFGGRGMGNRTAASSSESDDTSVKGIKAGTALWITDGIITVTSNSDTLHSDGNIYITGGEVTLDAGDDGIHADDTLEISDGTINVVNSYEAIEAGNTLTISGGTITANSVDDGLNLSGTGVLTISGSMLMVSAGFDAIDSNGTLQVSGGDIYLYTESNSAMTGAIDTDRGAVISGGTVLGMDAGSGLNFNTGTQAYASANISGTEGTVVTVTDSEGTEIASWVAPGNFSYVIFSNESMTGGSSYTVTAGTRSVTVTAVTSSSGNAGWGMPGQGGWGPNGGQGGGWGMPGQGGGGRGR